MEFFKNITKRLPLWIPLEARQKFLSSSIRNSSKASFRYSSKDALRKSSRDFSSKSTRESLLNCLKKSSKYLIIKSYMDCFRNCYTNFLRDMSEKVRVTGIFQNIYLGLHPKFSHRFHEKIRNSEFLLQCFLKQFGHEFL